MTLENTNGGPRSERIHLQFIKIGPVFQKLTEENLPSCPIFRALFKIIANRGFKRVPKKS